MGILQICGGLSQKQIQDLFDGGLFLKPGKEYRIPTDLSETGDELITGGGQVGSGWSSGGSSRWFIRWGSSGGGGGGILMSFFRTYIDDEIQDELFRRISSINFNSKADSKLNILNPVGESIQHQFIKSCWARASVVLGNGKIIFLKFKFRWR